MRTRNKDQDDATTHNDSGHFDTCKGTKWLIQSSGELQEIDLNKLIRMLK